jgi:hypothetical protein
MSRINRDGYLLLTNHLAKFINQGGQHNRTVSVNEAQLAQARPSNHPPYKYMMLELGSLISLSLPLCNRTDQLYEIK